MASALTEFEPGFEAPDSHWGAFAMVWRRKWIVALITIVGVGLGYLYYVKVPPVFRSKAQLLFQSNHRQVWDGKTEDVTTQSAHTVLLRSPQVVEAAVRKLKLGEFPSLRAAENAAGRIIGALQVTALPDYDQDVIELAYMSNDPNECQQVLQAIIAAYDEYLSDTFQSSNEQTVKLISKAKDELSQQLHDEQQNYLQWQKEHLQQYTTQTSETINQSMLAEIEQRKRAVVFEDARLRATIVQIRKAIEHGGNQEAINVLVRMIQANERQAPLEGPMKTVTSQEENRSRFMEEKLFPLLVESQMLAEKYGPDHPKMMSVTKQIEVTREVLLGMTPVDEAGQPTDFVQVYLEALEQQVKVGQETISYLEGLSAKENEAAREQAVYRIEDERFRTEIANKQSLFDTIIKHLGEITLLQETVTRMQVTQPPNAPQKVSPLLAVSLCLAGLAGLVAGAGLGVLVDLADKRFHSPDEIRNSLGVKVIGHIPQISATDSKIRTSDDGLSELDPVIRTVHQPRGRVAEAYRAVRTTLYFSTRPGEENAEQPVKLVQVTSPSPGDGKSTLAANLAVSIASSGRKILLIDADFRRPRCHKLFNLDPPIGMSSLIDDSAEIGDAVFETPIQNLHLLPCGPLPENPSELLTSARFAELLEVFREEYDLVLIDTPPILAVTDPVAVAKRVDGVVLVMRLTKDSRAKVKGAIGELNALGANILGVVVNGVPTNRTGYGYGTGYGSGYAYGGYGYMYSDRNNGDHEYYSEDAPAPVGHVRNGRG